MRGPVPQYYVVEEGILFAGEYPGSMDPELALRRLRHLIGLGVRVFIDLTTPEDRLDPYHTDLPALSAETGFPLRHIRLSIPDMDVPEDPAVMRAILDEIATAAGDTPAAYVHCWGGIGRTGTVTGCYFREKGETGDDALAHVQELYSTLPKATYNPFSPQTARQRSYVRDWISR